MPAQPGERRQLTVVFCDLVGSTSLANQLDPEDLREIIGAYNACVTETVAAFGGHVAQYLGDGALIYFGYPRAHETDVERGASAALALVERVRRLKASHSLVARIGMATGLTIVGRTDALDGSTDSTVVGSTPNLAARLQAAAEPGTVVVSAVTRRLLGELFRFERMEPLALKGFAEPVEAWRLVGPSGIASRFEALRRTTASAPLVGRAEEIETLRRRWQQVRSGEGRVVLLAGEAGIGKSRIVSEFIEHARADDIALLRLYCSPTHRDSVLFPFLSHVESSAGLDRTDSREAATAKLATLADGVGLTKIQGEVVASLLPITGPEPAAVARLSVQQRKEEIARAFEGIVFAASAHHPVLMLLEDAHWLDPTSRDLLDAIVQKVRNRPILLLVTFRPEFVQHWAGQSHVTSILLNRLDERSGAQILGHIVRSHGLPARVQAEIIRRTDGIPLYIEELTASVLESAASGETFADGGGPGAKKSGLSLPSTLEASLLARLDRLDADARMVAQVGAAIGREYSFALLQGVSGLSRQGLGKALEQLVQAGLIIEHGSPPDSSYTYKHALIRDAAYGVMLRGRRQDLHRRIAEALAAASDGAILRPEVLAHHLTEAGLHAAAVERWTEAGLAIRATANREASVFFGRAAELLAEAGGEVAAEHGIDIHLHLFHSLYPIGELERARAAIEKAENLAASLGDWNRLCLILAEKCYILASVGEVEHAIATGERALGLIGRAIEASVHVEVRMMLVRALYAAGRYRDALPLIADAIGHAGASPAPGETARIDLRFEVLIETWRALALAELGEYEQGEAAAQKATRRAGEADATEHDHLWSRYGAARVATLCGRPAAVIALMEPLLETTRENWHVYYSRVASALGIAYVRSGDGDRGLALLEDADRQAEAIGFSFGRGYVVALLAQALVEAGEPARAAETAKRALEAARQRRERGCEAWLTCVLAEALAAEGKAEAAAGLFATARDLALELGMKPVLQRCPPAP